MATKSTDLQASVLAFERKLDPSDALFYAGNWDARQKSDAWEPIKVNTKSVRGTISNRLKASDANDPAKLDAKIESPNLQTVDVAQLPHTGDTLKAQFTLRVLGGAGKPSACNSAAYQAKLATLVTSYVDSHGYGELARRYATNLANARWLWRNLASAETVEVHIRHTPLGGATATWTFAHAEAMDRTLFNATHADINAVAAVIEAALAGQGYALLEVTAFARMGKGQEVFPSQELILDKGKNAKSKTLYQVQDIAAMHSQKIGNAVRTIDTWHPHADAVGPIPVEPYGSVTVAGTAYRQPKEKVDFYSLLDNWIKKDSAPSAENQHFVMATLVRGGVFGESGKE